MLQTAQFAGELMVQLVSG